MMLENIKKQAETVVKELVKEAKLEENSILVVGCSSSEIIGSKIGTNSAYEVAEAVFSAVYPILKEKNINLACQCCEHLNRAIVVEKEVAKKTQFGNCKRNSSTKSRWLMGNLCL